MRGKVTAVVGTKWGDEGKGKIIDALAQKVDVVARATGGSNAGHRVVINGKAYPLHLLPSGVFNLNAKVVIGNGVLIDPIVLWNEVKALEKDGIPVLNRLYISEKAHVVLPIHIALDEYEESVRIRKIGTTKRGIGPTAEDKYGRFGIRMGDFLPYAPMRNCKDSVDYCLRTNYQIRSKMANEEMRVKLAIASCNRNEKEFLEAVVGLRDCVCDTISLVHQWLERGQNLLIEGAQATLLDIDFGTYPFVTSSNPTAAGMCTGIGIGPTQLTEVIGVLKAYESRVGEGPFPTEQNNELGNKIRELGHEYGTTTGRPRRCGWLDLVALKYACRVNGLTGLAVNHLDTIGKFHSIPVCTIYRNDDYLTEAFSSEVNKLQKCEPMYTHLKGDFGDISQAKSLDDLPSNAIRYLQLIADHTGVPIRYVGVGPEREHLIECCLLPEKMEKE